MLRNDPLVTFGSIKIIDGLFITDDIAAGDLEFISTNKVTRIINCCCLQVPNHWSSIGIKYLSYNWRENEVVKIKEETMNRIYEFIQQSLKKSECVLIHCINNESILYLVAGLFLMLKFKWSVNKAIQYMCLKQPCFYIVPQYYKALQKLENLMRTKYQEDVSDVWDLHKIRSKEEMVITNTYINTRIAPGNNLAQPAEEEKESSTFREQLQNNVPQNNRNLNQKSSTYNNEIKASKPTSRIKFKEEITTVIKTPLEEPNLAIRVQNLTDVNCHREEVALTSILCNKDRVLKPIPVMPSQKMSSKNKNNSFVGSVGRGLKKINESLEHAPSAKFYKNDLTPKETKPGKARKRVKSARPKEKPKKKESNKYEFMPNFHPHAYLREAKQTKKGKKKSGNEKGERKKRPQTAGNKLKNNYFPQTKGNMSLNPSSNEFQNILNKSGLSDIDMTKKLLLNKITNNEIDPNKYMRFVEANNRKNAPDEEAKEIKSRKGKKGGPVVNVNYNSYIRIGAYQPPVINTLIVNGNNYINQANNLAADKKLADPSMIQKPKILASSGSSKGKKKARPSSGSQPGSKKQYNSVNSRSGKSKEPTSQKKIQDGFNLAPFTLTQKNKLTTPTNQRDKPKKLKK
ncbi:unnamed protein product [Moneuplotes crassus]|uniref:Tyrosine-protein phosphatase domain-containing protein n=1 Tax=Euplotes crassus TaxID=5936 RepID=A0AAD1X3R8_EUPCR|nr:unnamed protein product [Moneuplotes crassus]